MQASFNVFISPAAYISYEFIISTYNYSSVTHSSGRYIFPHLSLKYLISSSVKPKSKASSSVV
nr:MAG TPA: hypothetical protein [Caudoviricetes sp.]